MKTLKALLAAPIFLGLLAGCQKDETETLNQQHSVEKFTDLQVPSNFHFEGFSEVDLDIRVENPYQNPYLIRVYDYAPAAGGNLIYSGYTRKGRLAENIMLPVGMKKLYVEKVAPTGASSLQVLEVRGNTASHNFHKKSLQKKTAPASPGCGTADCDQTVASGGINTSANTTYCITGSLNYLNDNSGSAVLRICGDVTISNSISIKGNTHIQIPNGSSLTIGGINMNSHNGAQGKITVYEGGTLNITQNFNPYGVVDNYGDITFDREVNFYGTFNNYGSVRIKGTNTSTASNSGKLTNYSSIVVDGHFNQNSNQPIENYCQFHIKKQFLISSNAIFENHDFLQVDGDFQSNSNSTLELIDRAMIFVGGDCYDPLNGTVTGTGDASVMKIDGGDLRSNSGSAFTGNLEVCVANGATSLDPNTNIGANASFTCGDVYVPTSGCNPMGSGSPTVTDSDGDGVADENDNYPADPNRSGDSYYPSANTFNTLVYEDLWPSKGDYDFNDLVLGYRFHFVTDANNDIMDIEVSYSVRAIGAGMKNGFGIELNLAPNAVDQVTRSFPLNNSGGLVNIDPDNGTEMNQGNAVIIFYTMAQDLQSDPGSGFMNTNPSKPYQQPDTATVKITFASAQDPAALGNAPYNPFIFVGQERGREVHLSSKQPTDLADINFFGTKQDATDPANGPYYVNKNNLPWALNLPVMFEYPTEKTDIILAYPDFVDWASSGGLDNTDWYLPANGDANYIYQKP